MGAAGRRRWVRAPPGARRRALPTHGRPQWAGGMSNQEGPGARSRAGFRGGGQAWGPQSCRGGRMNPASPLFWGDQAPAPVSSATPWVPVLSIVSAPVWAGACETRSPGAEATVRPAGGSAGGRRALAGRWKLPALVPSGGLPGPWHRAQGGEQWKWVPRRPRQPESPVGAFSHPL